MHHRWHHQGRTIAALLLLIFATSLWASPNLAYAQSDEPGPQEPQGASASDARGQYPPEYAAPEPPALGLRPPAMLEEPALKQTSTGMRLLEEVGAGLTMYLGAVALVGTGALMSFDGQAESPETVVLLYATAVLAVTYGVPWVIEEVGKESGIEGSLYLSGVVGLAFATAVTTLLYKYSGLGGYAFFGFPLLHVGSTAITFELSHSLASGARSASGARPSTLNPGVGVSFRF